MTLNTVNGALEHKWLLQLYLGGGEHRFVAERWAPNAYVRSINLALHAASVMRLHPNQLVDHYVT